MTRLIALKGNLTTTGGRVLDGDATMLDDGQPLARRVARALPTPWTERADL
jgi:hypothetical protein